MMESVIDKNYITTKMETNRNFSEDVNDRSDVKRSSEITYSHAPCRFKTVFIDNLPTHPVVLRRFS